MVTMGIQEGATALIVATAVIALVRKAYQTIRGRAGGCTGCATQKCSGEEGFPV